MNSFFVTRLIVEFFTPFVFSVFLFLCCFAALLFHKRNLALIFSGCGLLIIFFFGYGCVTKSRLNALESSYSPLGRTQIEQLKNENVRYVVVLGSGHVSDPRLPVTGQIGVSSLYRLVEALRIIQELQESILVISGGIGYDPVPNADIVSNVALSVGVPSERIIVENKPRDTLQEAQMLKPLLRKDKFVLITSAAHMTRAVEIFCRHGMNPVADPTDYIIKSSSFETADSLFPSMGNLNISRKVIYEAIGTIWMEFKENFRSSQ